MICRTCAHYSPRGIGRKQWLCAMRQLTGVESCPYYLDRRESAYIMEPYFPRPERRPLRWRCSQCGSLAEGIECQYCGHRLRGGREERRKRDADNV